MNNLEGSRTEAANQYERILKSIQNKEKQANDAKNKGMHASFSICMEEIAELKKKLRKQQSGGK